MNAARLSRRTAIVACLSIAAVDVARAAGARAATTRPDPATGETLVVPTHTRKPDKAAAAAEPCFPVREIRINGIERIAPAAVQARVEPLAGRCLGSSRARAIVAAINEAHAEQGYATTQGYLPDQDIRQTGVLSVQVVTGRIDQVIYREEAGVEGLGLAERLGRAWEPVRDHKGPWGLINAISGLIDTIDDPLDHFQIIDGARHAHVKRWSALAFQPGEAVNVNEIQEGVDALNRVPSNHAEAKLVPGGQPATSHVEVINRRRNSFRLTAGYEVNGTDLNQSGSTVASRLRVDMAKDNLIGVNDAWSTSFASGIDSNEVRGRFSLPWQRFSFAIEGGYSEQLFPITRTAELFYQAGNASASASYLLERGRTRQTTVDASLGWRQIDRHINSQRLTPQKIAPARLGLSRIHHFEGSGKGLLSGRQVSYGIGVSRGLTIWDATRDGPRAGPAAPRAQFWKLDAAAGFAQGLRDLGVLRIDVTGQWTARPLYQDEQMTLGSVSSVRGFTNTAAKVDRGVLVRSELALPVGGLMGRSDDKADPTFLNDMLRALQPYGFADGGHGRDLANARDLTRMSLGVGLRHAHGRTSFDLSVAYPVMERGAPRSPRGPEIYFTLNSRLF